MLCAAGRTESPEMQASRLTLIAADDGRGQQLPGRLSSTCTRRRIPDRSQARSRRITPPAETHRRQPHLPQRCTMTHNAKRQHRAARPELSGILGLQGSTSRPRAAQASALVPEPGAASGQGNGSGCRAGRARTSRTRRARLPWPEQSGYSPARQTAAFPCHPHTPV